jgi:hypothetical protein
MGNHGGKPLEILNRLLRRPWGFIREGPNGTIWNGRLLK